ncbi:hypothetical protein [Amycolatopsis thermoflava]|uniref:Uncharacterized protein n=1 Tax=Amycolatopsis thermoflava TaxID=84480 RepID=A0A3N2H5G2_9PSEU|nr:hypothetical protein [Amycolatopsis thermoflava]ROS44147.1 hypothetical protein EDD35_6577 [Amycolatopsis thermoflava]
MLPRWSGALGRLDQDEALVVSLAHAGRGTPEVHEGSRLRADASSAGLLFSAFDGPDGNLVRDGRIAVHRDITGRASMSAAITDKAGAVVAALTLAGGRGEECQRLRPALADAARTVRFSIYRDELLA